VTGASTGIGRASTLALLEARFRVFAGVRNRATADSLTQAAGPNADRLHTLQLDVTSASDIRAAANAVDAAVGADGLWGLFNNAGITVNGPLEFIDLDGLRRQLEVNLVSQVAVTQAFIPLLRTGHGRILSTGSVSGFIAMPCLGPYCMSKYAMEAFSDALRRELRPWGIQVSLLEPGTIASEIWGKGLADAQALLQRPPVGLVENYGPLLQSLQKIATESDARASPADVVARDVVHAFTARRPRTRYCQGRDSGLQRWISRLPDRWADAVIARFVNWG
jgi:NAD(P)-dependent dehydrogenase (short-subunit alcohol dehydrogenase family)